MQLHEAIMAIPFVRALHPLCGAELLFSNILSSVRKSKKKTSSHISVATPFCQPYPGLRVIDLRFGIYLRSFGPGGSQLEPHITPPEDFRSLLGLCLTSYGKGGGSGGLCIEGFYRRRTANRVCDMIGLMGLITGLEI
jgi:hypothetical protein